MYKEDDHLLVGLNIPAFVDLAVCVIIFIKNIWEMFKPNNRNHNIA